MRWFRFGFGKRDRDRRGRFTKTGVRKFNPAQPSDWNTHRDYFGPLHKIDNKEKKTPQDKKALADLERQWDAFQQWDRDQHGGMTSSERREWMEDREIDRKVRQAERDVAATRQRRKGR